MTPDICNRNNSAVKFNGNGYLTSNTATFLPTLDRTISFWFKTDNVSNGAYTMGYGGDGTCGTSYIHIINSWNQENKYSVSSHCLTNNIEFDYSNFTQFNPQNNYWTMWTLTSNSTHGTYMYLNDTLVAYDNSVNYDGTQVLNSILVFGSIPTVNGFEIGNDTANNDHYKGILDELRIYNRSMQFYEIESMYNWHLCNPTQSPTAIPSVNPTIIPTDETQQPSVQPSTQPSVLPSREPTSDPSSEPSGAPSIEPSYVPTLQPSIDTLTTVETTISKEIVLKVKNITLSITLYGNFPSNNNHTLTTEIVADAIDYALSSETESASIEIVSIDVTLLTASTSEIAVEALVIVITTLDVEELLDMIDSNLEDAIIVIDANYGNYLLNGNDNDDLTSVTVTDTTMITINNDNNSNNKNEEIISFVTIVSVILVIFCFGCVMFIIINGKRKEKARDESGKELNLVEMKSTSYDDDAPNNEERDIGNTQQNRKDVMITHFNGEASVVLNEHVPDVPDETGTATINAEIETK